jgi:putative RNA 2'-phosphotransferase
MNLVTVSKYMAKYLRHNPEDLGLKLSEGGWVDVEDFISASVRKGFRLDLNTILEVVRTDNKQRYSYDEMGKRLRANQGHSVFVNMKFEERIPPEILYHGTAARFVDSIFRDGLKPMSRQYVHLSSDIDTAMNVGKRHGGYPVLLKVLSGPMYNDGKKFYQSENGVWLVGRVGVEYLRKV